MTLQPCVRIIRCAMPEHPPAPPRLLHGDITKIIFDAFFELRSLLGPGLLEGLYANGLVVLLEEAGLTVEREVKFDVLLRGRVIGRYRADMVVDSRVIVEVKRAARLTKIDEAQLLNYLAISHLDVGLLLNFGTRPEFRRLVAPRTSGTALQRRRKR